MKTILVLIILCIIAIGCQGQSYNYDSRIREIVGDSITVRSISGDVEIETVTANGESAITSTISSTSYYSASYIVDSTMVNGLIGDSISTSETQLRSDISDSLDAVYIPIMLWTASDVADTSLNDSIEAGNYSKPPDDRYPGFYTDHESYIKVLRISYYQSAEIDSIAFINESSIGIGGEDGYIRMGVVGHDSVEVTDNFPFDATPRLSMSGASTGKTTIEIEIKTSDSGTPFVCYPICIIGYYKLR